MSDKVLGFPRDSLVCGFCEEKYNEKTKGYANYMCSKCHKRLKPQTERTKLVPVVLKEEYDMALEENKMLKRFLRFVCNQNNIDYKSVWKKIKPDKWKDYLANIIKT